MCLILRGFTVKFKNGIKSNLHKWLDIKILLSFALQMINRDEGFKKKRVIDYTLITGIMLIYDMILDEQRLPKIIVFGFNTIPT